MSDITVLGSGMGAYGAAYCAREAGRSCALYDKRSYYGGNTASTVFEGKYTFDEGPHISFSSDERIKKIWADAVDQQYEKLVAKVNNYWKGHWIKHPAQVNLHGLPSDLVVKIICDYVAAKQAPPAAIDNYEQWLRASFGNTFAETFPMQYALKVHTTAAANLSTDWIGPRLYQAKLEELLAGALAPSAPDVHYIDNFRYPTRGGYVSYLRRFLEAAELHLEHRLVSLDPKAKELTFANGAVVPYKALVSSVPLPDFIPLIAGAPPDVVAASQRLACTEVVLVNLVADRTDLVDANWTYFYDLDVCFTRLSTPHRWSPHNFPAGCGALQAELYFSKKYKPRDVEPAALIAPVIRDLQKVGILRPTDRVLFQDARRMEYGNIIFDLERAEAVKTVLGYLDDLGIATCGRYGEWAYLWTDQSFQSGEKAMQKTLSRL